MEESNVPTSIIMPALGLAQDVGKVLRWLKAEGETVAKGEPLLEVETDKATVELEAPATGVLTAVSAVAGQEVPVGQVIAWVVGEGEQLPTMLRQAPPETVDRERGEQTVHGHPMRSGVATTQLRPHASPKARRLARQLGVDLERVRGTGPGGAVLAADILRTSPTALTAGLGFTPAPQAVGETMRVQTQPAYGTVWRLMAERTAESWTTAPHFYLFREVRAHNLLAWYDAMRATCGSLITVTDLLVHRVASTLKKHPLLNSSWSEQGVVSRSEINLGLVVAVDHGVVIPVIKDADVLSVPQIAHRRREVVDRARAGRLAPDDLQGGTFTISNLGMHGIDAFLAILNPQQAAILSVGRIADRVVAVDGRPAVQPTLVLAISCDHRLVDGVSAARFLIDLTAAVEAAPPC
jgi:pyruvate dehydrogenase E2 component (dihydrolipoamide acetyltransferase)